MLPGPGATQLGIFLGHARAGWQGGIVAGLSFMLAAFVGYKLSGVIGSIVASGAIFLPSFLMMLCIVPLLDRVKQMPWLRAFMRGTGPAVIGVTGVALGQMIPHAAPDAFTLFLLAGTIILILVWKLGPLPLMIGGAVIGAKSTEHAYEQLREWTP